MKTYKICYKFLNRDYAESFWDIANAVVVAENEKEAIEMFWEDAIVDSSFHIVDVERIVNKSLIWAF